MSDTIKVKRLGTETILVPLRGTAPLIVHKFSEKAKRQMLDTMQGRKSPREVRDPDADYTSALYRMDDEGYGFPVVGLKAATVSAARFYGSDVTMTMLRQALFFRGEFSKVEGQQMARIHSEPWMREDVVRVGRGGTDLRYRPQFDDWTTSVEVTYIKSLLTRDSVLSLVEAGGLGVGIGEWRPEKSGGFGTFQIDETREVQVIDG